LNLTRPNPLGPAGNYYGLVRPEMNFRSAIGLLQTEQGVLSLDQAAMANALSQYQTGHASRFMTQSRYFMNNGGQGAAGGGAAAGGAAGAVGTTGAQTGAQSKAGRR
jgi:hypothetical protein